MKNLIKILSVMICGLLLFGCTGFNDVQIAKIQYDQTRIEALRDMEVAKHKTDALMGSVKTPADAEAEKFEKAGFLVETDDAGRIKTVAINKCMFIGSNCEEAGDAFKEVAGAAGYQPKESSVVKDVGGIVTNLAKFGLYGYAIGEITDAMGNKTTTYSAGGDQAVNTGMNGSAYTSNSPIADSYNDMSNNPIDNSNNPIDNSDNRYDYNNQTAEPTVVDPVIVDPVIVPPPVPSTVDPVIVNPVIVPTP